MNQFIIIGKALNKPVINKDEDNNSHAELLVEVQRTYKNLDGIYESDTFAVTLYKSIADKCAEYVEEGVVVGIKGYLQENNYTKDDEVYYYPKMIADKVSFLYRDDK